MIENNLHVLGELIPISHAEVELNKQPETTPRFRVSALLAVPGPDIHAVACDHTLRAALQKLVSNLKKQFQRRVARRDLRLRNREQFRSVARLRTSAA